MSLTILGRDASDHTVWVDVDGDTFPLPPYELSHMRADVMAGRITKRAGHAFDEEDVNALINAMRNGSDLEPCRYDGDPAPFQTPDGWLCVGHATALSDAENASDEAVRSA